MIVEKTNEKGNQSVKEQLIKVKKWGCGGDGEGQWKISADPLIPALIYLSLLSTDRFPLTDLSRKKKCHSGMGFW